MLHETAVSWIRHLLIETTPKKAWQEDRSAYSDRLRAVCRTVNAKYNVESLCKGFTSRLEEVKARKGDRLTK
jgi:hypothetical protein